jgi:hypothetical protein
VTIWFGLWAFDSDMIDLSVIVLLPLGIKISVRASDNCEDCAVDGEGIGLL